METYFRQFVDALPALTHSLAGPAPTSRPAPTARRHLHAGLAHTLKTGLVLAVVRLLAAWRWLLERQPKLLPLLFLPGMEGLRWRIGQLKALGVYEQARRRTPAYRAFLAARPGSGPRFGRGRLVPDFSGVPVMDKDNYVRPYSIAARCRGGRVPAQGVIVDESSGSSGTATNWLRGRAERQANKQMLEFGLRHLLGPGPHFVLNAFAMGPWATGVNITMGLTDVAVLKSTGPDVAKIVHTLQFFGPGHRYVILGYPPFLKLLVDTAGLRWADYDVTMLYGGEGLSERLRDYLLAQGIRRVYGSLGASDLELNMAAENDFTIGLRRALLTRPDLAARLLRFGGGALPVIFQYNPADFYLEATAEGELLVTLCRPHYLSPKVRYNLHDRVQLLRFPELRELLAAHGLTPRDLSPTHSDLPLLLHYGRADMAVPYFGCKLAPPDVQETLLGVPDLASRIASFALLTSETAQATQRLRICLELHEGHFPPPNEAFVSEQFFAELCRLNQDFREAWRMAPAAQHPRLAYFAHHTGPFEQADARVKCAYIQAA